MANTARLPLLAAAVLLACPARAAISMPAIFSDGLVLQTHHQYGQQPNVFGWADPGETVTVNTSVPLLGVSSYTVDADATGFFIVILNVDLGPTASEPFSIFVSGSSAPQNVTVINGVSFGEVLLCSGQSNMVLDVRSSFNASAAAATYPNIRLFAVVQGGADTPQRDFPPCTQCQDEWHDLCRWSGGPALPGFKQVCNAWQVAEPGTTDYMSAVCFFTGLELSKQLAAAGRPNVTIGLIHSAVSGTAMRLWVPPSVNAACNASNATAAGDDAPTGGALGAPGGLNNSALFNAMIAPMARLSLRAVIWDQGEGDSGSPPAEFDCLFGGLIEAWRRLWRIGDFAWIFVQLGAQDTPQWPNYWYPSAARDAQTAMLPRTGGLADTTGEVPTYDLADFQSPFPPDHVHYRAKAAVGYRAALQLMHVQYGWQWPAGGANLTGSTINWSGPTPVAAAPVAGSAAFTLQFATLDGQGIYLHDTGSCWECCAAARDTVQLACDDNSTFPWINTTISVSPSQNGTLLVTPTGKCPDGVAFAQIRYAYNMLPQCAVYAVGNGVPVTPFTLNLTAATPAAMAAEPSTPRRHQRAVKVGSKLPVAQRGPKTWTSWKGRPITKLNAGDGIVAATPPLGFNSWNAFRCNVDERLLQHTADAFVELGLAELGWDTIVSDDCWQVDRYPNGSIIADPVRFPSGMRATADYIHSLGLKYGVYTAATEQTCQLRPGSYQVEPIDAATYCSWGLDFVKIDFCVGPRWPDLNTSWIAFRKGINACVAGGGRDIAMSVEYCRANDQQGCQSWVGGLANMWRTTDDIQPNWASVLSNMDGNNNGSLPLIAGPGHWNDPDMLQVGNPGLSFDEQKSHFGAWCIMAAPLLIGTDLVSGVDNATLSILTAAEVIAVDQDPLGVQGIRVSAANATGGECWAKPLADGSVAALLLNRGTPATTVTCTWEQLGLKQPNGAAAVRDLWARADIGSFTGGYSAQLGTHQSALVRVTQ